MRISARRSAFVLFFFTMAMPAAESQVSFSISGYCRRDNITENLNPSLVNPNITVSECWSAGIPFTRGLASIQLMTTGTLCAGLDATLSFETTNTLEEIATNAPAIFSPLNAALPISPCPPTVIVDYGRHAGSQDAYSISAGSLFSNGPTITKHIQSEMRWEDTVSISTTSARTIALPVGAIASIFAAESFGTAATRGHAKVTVTGSVGSVMINETIEVESVSVIPTQDSINLSRLVQIPLVSGLNTINIQLFATAEVTATAQGAGLITGSATAGVNFGNGGLTIGRFKGDQGSPLPNDILIVSTRNCAIYEDTTTDPRWAKMGFACKGTSRAPELIGTGPIVEGQQIQLEVHHALPNAAGIMVVGFDTLFLLFEEGVLVPSFVPPGFVVPLMIDASGQRSLSFVVPPGLPPGFESYFQVWILDPGGLCGLFSATNAVQAITAR